MNEYSSTKIFFVIICRSLPNGWALILIFDEETPKCPFSLGVFEQKSNEVHIRKKRSNTCVFDLFIQGHDFSLANSGTRCFSVQLLSSCIYSDFRLCFIRTGTDTEKTLILSRFGGVWRGVVPSPL